MANGYQFTNNGVKALMDRFIKSSPTYSEPTYGSVGTGTTTPEITDTALQTPITIDASTYLAWDQTPTVDNTAKRITVRYRVAQCSVVPYCNLSLV